jgi:hypothetical protein
LRGLVSERLTRARFRSLIRRSKNLTAGLPAPSCCRPRSRPTRSEPVSAPFIQVSLSSRVILLLVLNASHIPFGVAQRLRRRPAERTVSLSPQVRVLEVLLGSVASLTLNTTPTELSRFTLSSWCTLGKCHAGFSHVTSLGAVIVAATCVF